MAISSLVVRSGVGAWADIAHLITRGLYIGERIVVISARHSFSQKIERHSVSPV